jgi:hypothetical protein
MIKSMSLFIGFVLCVIDLLVLLVDTLFLFVILYCDTVRSIGIRGMQKDGEKGPFENAKMRLTRNMFILIVCRFVSSVRLFFFSFIFIILGT